MLPLFAGHNHRAPSSLRNAALHHQRIAGFHASCSHSTQRHRFLLWQPQSLGYGMAEHILHESLMFQWKLNWELNVKIQFETMFVKINKWIILFSFCLKAKAGFILNIIGILCINLGINTWGMALFNLGTFPSWANATNVTSTP